MFVNEVTRRHNPAGLLEPLPIPTRSWESVNIDVTIHLPLAPKAMIPSSPSWIDFPSAQFISGKSTATAEDVTYGVEDVYRIPTTNGWPDRVRPRKCPRVNRRLTITRQHRRHYEGYHECVSLRKRKGQECAEDVALKGGK